MPEATVEAATVDDARTAADLAAEKRAEYERYSPVFWRVAQGARAIHEPFLAKCIASPEFTSLAARCDAMLTEADDVPPFDRWAAASGAVLAIVPARSNNPEIEDALGAAGYEPASDWLVKDLT